MANINVRRWFPLAATALGFVLMIWGFALNLAGHESAQSWSLIGVGAATLGSSPIAWRKRG